MARVYERGRSAERMRRMYPGGRATAGAKRYARAWVRVISTGLLPSRWVVLAVPGRSSGAVRRVPLGMADVGGRWYLVSMLGECNWTRNVRAAGGEALLDGRRRGPVRLTEVPAADRGPILRRYLEKVPGARAHIRPLDTPAATAVACAHTPVFRVDRG
jgi:deazaflavin-dependent oxidoreductase (nitroreductase family)